jgi:hypothetical protein
LNAVQGTWRPSISPLHCFAPRSIATSGAQAAGHQPVRRPQRHPLRRSPHR